jgi:hypothetical protein
MTTPMKLGRLPKREDPRTLKLEKYLAPKDYPIVPNGFWWSKWCPQNLGMMKNDKLGDCVCAGVGHAIQSYTGNSFGRDHAVTVSDDSVVKMYQRVGGYVPGNPSTDNGCYMIDGAKDFVKTGLEGHKARAFVEVARDPDLMRVAGWLFSGLYMGAWIFSNIWGADVWDAPSASDTFDGGHCIFGTDVDVDGMSVVTWGKHQRVSWRWATSPKVLDEAYVFVTDDQLTKLGQSVPGFDVDQMLADLALVKK